MIFFKNIIRKKRIQNYILTLLVILGILISIETINIYLDNRNNEIKNSQDKRTIVINSQEDCETFEKYDLESCNIKDNTTNIVLSSVKLKEKFISEYESVYSIMTFSDQDNNIENLIKGLQVMCILIIITLFIIITIIQYIFIVEDKEVCAVLHSIGYSKFNIIIKNTLSMNVFYSLIFAILLILILIVYLTFFKYVINLHIFANFILTYLSIIIFSDILYFIEYRFINR